MHYWSKSIPLLCLLGHRSTAYAFVRPATRTAAPCCYYSTTTTTALGAQAQQYLLTYDYVPDVLEKRGPYRAEHLQLAADAVQDGQCAYGGPKAPTTPEGAPPNGALFIFNTLRAAQEFVQKDPYVSGGIVTAHTIEAWTVAVSKEE